ncbi:hypothetical protein ACGF13_14260 [Kitasatospora sp. NPDC048286]|uniref:hypothetical protein n=1 Tax=Kitasatospora sp. NPDC048286 TaxID=3364047 RepID=UPI003710EA6E
MQDTEPDRCPTGEKIRPDPPGPDAIATWRCPCGYFGYVLPEDYLKAHPEEVRVQVCGRKRLSSVPAPVVA